MPANKNICDCPNPPGGRAVCELHQLAMCRVKDGVAHTQCFDLPRNLQGPDVLQSKTIANWALSHITGVRRPYSMRISLEDRRILSQGQYVVPDTGELVSFRLPRALHAGRVLRPRQLLR